MKYTTPEVELVMFTTEDVITTSGGGGSTGGSIGNEEF